jgi:hypothetical protein
LVTKYKGRLESLCDITAQKIAPAHQPDDSTHFAQAGD